jgi:hypothetical protein
MASVAEDGARVDASLSIFSSFTDHMTRMEPIVKCVKAKPPGVRLTVHKKTMSHSVYDSSKWTRQAHPVDVSELNHILHVDTERRLAIVEGQVWHSHASSASLIEMHSGHANAFG